MRKFLSRLFIVFSLVVVSACGSATNLNATSSSQLGSGQITQMTYQVTGGQNLAFTVTPASNGSYLVVVTQFNFQQRNQQLVLGNNVPAFAIVSEIFSRTVIINAAQSNVSNGSFSQMSLSTGSSSVTIQQPTINGDTSQFSLLYQWVASQMGY